jgi:hypothetical protein
MVQLDRLFSNVAVELCRKQAALFYILHDNLVGPGVPPHTSYRVQIERIAAAATPSIPIVRLSVELDQKGAAPRGNTFFGNAAKEIDRIASNCDGMRWWITEEGLVEPTSNLSDFDATAGSLMATHFKNGRLNSEALEAIAKELDARQFSLLDALRSSDRKKVADYNQHHPQKALKTFQQAIGHRPDGPRGVRRALYVARDRYRRSKDQPSDPLF